MCPFITLLLAVEPDRRVSLLLPSIKTMFGTYRENILDCTFKASTNDFVSYADDILLLTLFQGFLFCVFTQIPQYHPLNNFFLLNADYSS